MKLVLYNDYRPGAVTDRGVVDLSPALAAVGDLTAAEVMPALIAHFDYLRDEIDEQAETGEAVPLASVQLRAPNPRPRKLLCAVANYLEFGRRPRPPIDWFFKSPESVIGPEETVVLPPHAASIFHHEAELAAVIKDSCRNVPASEAMQHIFGYTCFIDVSRATWAARSPPSSASPLTTSARWGRAS